MATYSGVLEMLGNSTIDNNTGSRVYSVVEIGEHSLRSVRCSQYLANYLQVGEQLEIEVAEISFLKFVLLIGIWPAAGLVMLFIGEIAIGLIILFVTAALAPLVRKGSKLNRPIKSVTLNGKTYKN